MNNPRILFILKSRENYDEFTTTDDKFGTYSSGRGFSSGLTNSARFVVDMLVTAGIETKIVQVLDNNFIDHEVTEYQPTHVIIEAFWVVPEKFDVLQVLHPDVQWVIRGHSEIPFLANEGIAVDWLNRYVQYENVSIAANSEKSLRDIRLMIENSNPSWSQATIKEKVAYMPNFYPTGEFFSNPLSEEKQVIDVACFGAIRPLKNNLAQAMAAIQFANIKGKKLRFHINATRNEQGGNNNIKNIRALFDHDHSNHVLVEHPWVSHAALLHVLQGMDISMNVSFTESFNIVAADSVVSGVALVVSSEVYWSSQFCYADPASTASIVKTMLVVTSPYLSRFFKYLNYYKLRSWGNSARVHWLNWIRANYEGYFG